MDNNLRHSFRGQDSNQIGPFVYFRISQIIFHRVHNPPFATPPGTMQIGKFRNSISLSTWSIDIYWSGTTSGFLFKQCSLSSGQPVGLWFWQVQASQERMRACKSTLYTLCKSVLCFACLCNSTSRTYQGSILSSHKDYLQLNLSLEVRTNTRWLLACVHRIINTMVCLI